MYMKMLTNYMYFHSKCKKINEKLTTINIYEINTKCIHTFHTKYNKIIGTLTTNIWKFITIQWYSMEQLCIFKKMYTNQYISMNFTEKITNIIKYIWCCLINGRCACTCDGIRLRTCMDGSSPKAIFLRCFFLIAHCLWSNSKVMQVLNGSSV